LKFRVDERFDTKFEKQKENIRWKFDRFRLEKKKLNLCFFFVGKICSTILFPRKCNKFDVILFFYKLFLCVFFVCLGNVVINVYRGFLVFLILLNIKKCRKMFFFCCFISIVWRIGDRFLCVNFNKIFIYSLSLALGAALIAVVFFCLFHKIIKSYLAAFSF